jgi:hypothetical protein
MSKSELLNFKSFAPTEKPQDECGYSGNESFKGSVCRECMLADRISCPDWNTPEIFNNCTFAKREAQYRQDGIVK